MNELQIAREALKQVEDRECESVKETFEKMHDLVKIRKLIKILQEQEVETNEI